MFLTVCFVVAGCARTSQSSLPFEEIQLHNIYEIYQSVIKQQEKPPRDLSDLTQPQYTGMHPGTVRDLREGKYIVVFDVMSKDARTLLAYEARAAEQGGAVLMADGTVKTMTAAQFKSAKPAP